MKSLLVRIGAPDATPRTVDVGRDTAQPLSRLLEERGIGLNTRCGGKGLCKGCEVQLAGRKVRSCQISVAEALEQGREVTVPKRSRRDNAISGVNTFELVGAAASLESSARAGLGLAIDVGTTTVAVALWDLNSGACLAQVGAGNAQRRFGDNVLARIDHAIASPHGVSELQEVLMAETISPLLQDVLRKTGRDRKAIRECVVAGNTVMQHTVAAETLAGFARFPFAPRFLAEKTLPASALGLPGDFPVLLVGSLGPFVGADISAGALACGMLGPDFPCSLLIDFGTNGEILLRTGDRFFATATAVGPAFEGGRLTHGATAAPGIVSNLSVVEGEWVAERIAGNATGAPGICGAAYIHFIAEAHAQGWLNDFGRFTPQAKAEPATNIRCEAELRCHVAPGLWVSEPDIAELLQAKAAIGAGIKTLLEVAGIGPDALEQVFVAGSFGYHLNPSHARAVGMLPAVPLERVRLVGNSSLGGASLLLLHPGLRQQVEAMRERTAIVELNLCPTFGDNFADCQAIGPVPEA
ncbi:ASKHA domain-containing protein [Nibricoccus sp. IMCC34717]|uniref:ASKHA domain-containing protein n=1 Tax=Nibricoccus sp. IMCC34717 TaxID=3034021 RepID=UPI00384A8333